ncbi:MAG: molybdopterin-dependent oxidoreductase, partial [Terracidiphilus sp.]
GSEIVRADNRDKSGINNDFLCAKGRFGFDFVENPERLTTPLVLNTAGDLEPATWEHALRFAAGRLTEIRDSKSSDAIGVIGSNLTTNEENYLLQKFARTVLRTNNIDHERTADYAAFASALAGNRHRAAGLREIANAPAILLIGGNPTDEHPLLAWELRTNVRLNHAKLYIANTVPIKLERQARNTLRLPAGGYNRLTAYLDGSDTTLGDAAFRDAVLTEGSLLVTVGADFTGSQLESLIQWGLKRENVRFACLGDHANSRGAADMGLLPDMLPGYVPVGAPAAFGSEYPGLPSTPGKSLEQMLSTAVSGAPGALLIVGANPFSKTAATPASLKETFLVVQDIFLTETAALADVVLPATSLYEKTGTITNTYGDLQLARKAADHAGVKPDFEILVRLADAMGADVKKLVPFGKGGVTADLGQSRGAQAGEADRHAIWLAANGLEPKLSPFDPLAVLDEIERLVPGYKLDRLTLFGGNDVPTEPGFVPVSTLTAAAHVSPAHDGLFTSGTLGRYSQALRELEIHQESLPAEAVAD